jgi:tyrosinase
MNVELQINNSSDPSARFVTWAPSPCRIRMTDPAGAPGPTVNVRLRSVSGANGGTVRFRANPTGPFSNSLTFPVPTGGASVNFFVAGKFGEPSTSLNDVTIEARSGTTLIGSVDVMVRIRKNANDLTTGERDRFIAAFAELNNQGLGRFADFRDMHTAVSSPEAHGEPGFLPWHRAYLLDLERELQAIDPSVALPYWRFDQPAPNLFTLDFMGESDALGNVQFSATNPLQFWHTDGVPGVLRRPLFDTAADPAFVISEADTLALGSDYVDFIDMEGDPHGSAHVSFGGSISSVPTAAKDPLFFLLHCNVDRLWAKWQEQNSRFDAAVAESYTGDPTNRVGHNLADTMWPWNGVTTAPRPPTAPGGTLATSPCVTAPGLSPKVADCLDYRGVINSVSRMGFDYDDVDVT